MIRKNKKSVCSFSGVIILLLLSNTSLSFLASPYKTDIISRRIKFYVSPVTEIVKRWENIESNFEYSIYEKSDKKFNLLQGLLAEVAQNNIDIAKIKENLETLQEEGKNIPQDILEFLQFLIKSPPAQLEKLAEILRDVNENRIRLNSLEKEMKEAQDQDFDNYVGDKDRKTRMERAYRVSKDLQKIQKKIESISGVPFFNSYIQQLWIRVNAVNYENVLYAIARNNIKAGVIGFEYLRSLRGDNYTWGPDGVTMRQYVALHTRKSNIYGLAITEAENKPKTTQKDHNHWGFEEETFFLSDNITITSGEKKDDRFYSVPKTGQTYNFGEMSYTPAGVQHRLSNPNSYPSIDFTLKGPVAQILKGPQGPKGQIGKSSPQITAKPWGAIYTQIYKKNGGRISTGVEMERDCLVFKEDGWLEETNPQEIAAQVVVVASGEETDEFPFVPLSDETQVIRIFPWPKNIPEGTEKWLSKENLEKIKAKVTVIDEYGNRAVAEVKGGDVIVLNNKGNKLKGFEGQLPGRIVRYKIKNLSENNYELMSLTLVPGSVIQK